MDQTEAPADYMGIAENPLDALRLGVRDYIKILWSAAQKQVADCASDNIGFMAIFAESLNYADGIRVHSGPVNAVLGLCINKGLRDRAAVFISAIADEQRGTSPCGVDFVP